MIYEIVMKLYLIFKKKNNNNFSILLDNFTKLDSTSDI